MLEESRPVNLNLNSDWRKKLHESIQKGFNKVNFGLGLNFVNNSVYFKNNRLALEFLIPIYRDYEGIQMADSFSFVLGWQY